MIRTTELVDIYTHLTRARDKVERELRERLSWQDLCDLGLKLSAIIKFRDESDPPVTLIQAKTFIDGYEKRRNLR